MTKKNITAITNTLIIDFETYYDDEYTLKDNIPSLYLLDERFEIILASVIFNDNPPLILKGEHEVLDYFKTIDLNDTIVVSHTKFDLAILQVVLGVELKYTSDTHALTRVYGLHAITDKQSASIAAIGDLLVSKNKLLVGKGSTVKDMKGKRLKDLTTREYDEYAAYCVQDTVIAKYIWDNTHKPLNNELCHIDLTNKMYLNHNLELDNVVLIEYIETLLLKRRDITKEVWGALPKVKALLRIAHKKLITENAGIRNPAFTEGVTWDNIDCATDNEKMLVIMGVVNAKDFFDSLVTPTINDYCITNGLTLPRKIPKVKIPKALEGETENQKNVRLEKTAIIQKKLNEGVPDFTKKEGFLPALIQDENFKSYAPTYIYALLDFKLNGYNGLAYTRAKKFLRIAELSKNSRLPISLGHGGANTLRYAGEEVNPQNLPRDDTTLKKSIIAPDGKILIACDSAQIEARVIPWLCRHDHTINLFREKRDIYCDTAAAIFGLTYDEIFHRSKTEPDDRGVFMRRLGKETALAAQYGTGAERFSAILSGKRVVLPAGLTAEQIIKSYRFANKPIVDMWYNITNDILPRWINGEVIPFLGPHNEAVIFDGARKILGERVPTIWLPDNTPIVYPNLRFEKMEKYGKFDWFPVVDRRKGAKPVVTTESLWGGLIIQNITQAYAFASIIRQQMVAIQNDGYGVSLNVHDEVIVSVKETELAPAIKSVVKHMVTPPDYCKDLPLACELDVGYNLKDMVTVYQDSKYLYDI